MKRFIIFYFVILVSLIAPAWGLEQQIGLVSNYLHEGESLSNDRMAVQYQLEQSFSANVYSGLLASTAEIQGKTGLQVDYYVGFTAPVSDHWAWFAQGNGLQNFKIDTTYNAASLSLGGIYQNIRHWFNGHVGYNLTGQYAFIENRYEYQLNSLSHSVVTINYYDKTQAVTTASLGIEQTLAAQNLIIGASIHYNQKTQSAGVVLRLFYPF